MLQALSYLCLLLLLALCAWSSPTWAAEVELEAEAEDAFAPADLLNVHLPPPPRRAPSRPMQLLQENIHAAQDVDAAQTSLAELSTQATLSAAAGAHASVAARVAHETSQAVDQAALASASIEQHVTAAGALSAEEEALVRMVPVPDTSIPDSPAIPIQYMAPPTVEVLPSQPIGSRGYPWPEKLKMALNTIIDAARTRMSEMKREKAWSNNAAQLVKELGLKKHKVAKHIAQLTEEVKELLGKKKKIQNKILQDQLVERLVKTHTNLKKIRRQSQHIKKNQAKMITQKENLARALESIKRSLALLKGMKRERKFPSRGVGEKMLEDLSKYDPDLSFEKEADEVRALMFPDAVLAQIKEETQ